MTSSTLQLWVPKGNFNTTPPMVGSTPNQEQNTSSCVFAVFLKMLLHKSKVIQFLYFLPKNFGEHRMYWISTHGILTSPCSLPSCSHTFCNNCSSLLLSPVKSLFGLIVPSVAKLSYPPLFSSEISCFLLKLHHTAFVKVLYTVTSFSSTWTIVAELFLLPF